MSLKINENVDLKDGNSVASGTHFCYSGIYAYRTKKGETENVIGSVDETTNKIVLSGVDLTGKIKIGSLVKIMGSTGNDGEYSVDTCVLNGSDTEIVVNEDITDGTDDGNLVYNDFAYMLEVGVVGFASEAYCNKNMGNPQYSLNIDPNGIKPIKTSYIWEISISEYETGQFNNIADSKFKESLVTAGYTDENIVID